MPGANAVAAIPHTGDAHPDNRKNSNDETRPIRLRRGSEQFVTAGHRDGS